MQITLKISPSMAHNSRSKTVALYVYLYTNEHILIPRSTAGVYGSGFKKLLVSENTSYRHNWYVKRNKVIDLDKSKPGHRCDHDGDEVLVGRCIVRYTESVNNCTTYGLMANKTKKICNKDAKIELYSTWLEEEIFNLTGCLQKCERDIISLKTAPDSYKWPAKPNQQYVTIRLQYEDGSYKLTEEYEDYDMSSFIADVGGYLGLLLGHSVLSIYFIGVDLMKTLKEFKIKRFVFSSHYI